MKVWQEESKIIPTDIASDYYFGWDVSLSGGTDNIRPSLDHEMGSESGSVYVFGRRDSGTLEEIHKLTPADGDAGDCFGFMVNI